MIIPLSKGAIHEVYSGVMITGGLIVCALGVLIQRLDGAARIGHRLWEKSVAQEQEAKRQASETKRAESEALNAVAAAVSSTSKGSRPSLASSNG
jgi:Na+-transporting methylmalonyl-CoA/oxaloacetate decarboxylase gamma subunit